MPPSPKPSRKDRKQEVQERKRKLQDYRKQQYLLASSRDKGLCVFCWFLKNKQTPADDIHHVYGRSNKSGKDIWRESVNCLLSTCRTCHPQPIIIPGGSRELSWVEDVLKLANAKPINPEFTPKN